MDDWLQRARQTLDQVAQEAQKVATEVAQETQKAFQGVAAEVTGQGAPRPSETPMDPGALEEAPRAAFYGALFAMANADGAIDKDELRVIFELLDLEGISTAGRRMVLGYTVQPPRLLDPLLALEHAEDQVRFGLMVNLIEVAWANDLLGVEQRYALEVARQQLRVSEEQLQALEQFVQQVRAVQARGLDDSHAAETVRRSVAGLAAVGVPVAAVYFSGSVIGLSAAGIISGLAALGLGLGLVPGIGVAILLGTGAYLGISRLLGQTGGRREQERLRARAQRQAFLLARCLHEAIAMVEERLQTIQRAHADREQIRELEGRLRALQQLLARYQRLASGVAS
jgi:uncharacterized membrane protein YebE (DUF533 family)